MILKKNTLDIHPARILETNAYHRLWRTVIRIQAIYRARHDAIHGTNFLDNFRRTLQENYRFRDPKTEYVRQAQQILSQIFSDIYVMIASIDHNDTTSIEQKYDEVLRKEYESPAIKPLSTAVQRQVSTFRLPPPILEEDDIFVPRSLFQRFDTAGSISPQPLINSSAVNAMILTMFNREQQELDDNLYLDRLFVEDKELKGTTKAYNMPFIH